MMCGYHTCPLMHVGTFSLVEVKFVEVKFHTNLNVFFPWSRFAARSICGQDNF